MIKFNLTNDEIDIILDLVDDQLSELYNGPEGTEVAYKIDISVEMTTSGNLCYVSIYNDRNDKSVAFQVTKDKVKGLADFFIKNLGNN